MGIIIFRWLFGTDGLSLGFQVHAICSYNSCVVVSQITELCLDFICYDPNYNYGSDDEDEFMETDMEDDEEE